MPEITEPTLRDTLWSWLNNLGCRVAGEVQVGERRIDIVAKTMDGEYHGYEVKDQLKLENERTNSLKSEEIRKLANQLNDYYGFFDRVYYCSQEPEKVIQKFDRENVLLDMQGINDGEPILVPDRIGHVKIPLEFESDETPQPQIVEESDKLSRRETPSLPRRNETWVQHHVWDKYKKDGFVVIREGVIPQLGEENNEPSKIDILALTSKDTTKIYNEQDKHESIIGIEAKGENIEASKVVSQLERYLSSGALTGLYLAVPESSKQQAIDILTEEQTDLSVFVESENEGQNILSKVGIITVDENGTTEKIRSAKNLEMKFDGIRKRRNGSNCISVGWGSLDSDDCSRFESVYDQEDELVKMAHKIDVNPEYEPKLWNARQKVIGGGEPTEVEENLIRNTYENQYGDGSFG